MKNEEFDKSLVGLKGDTAKASRHLPLDAGTGSLRLTFNRGSRLRAEYWRLLRDGKAGVSSFDDQQQYGLQSRIDSILELQGALEGKPLDEARFDSRTGDLLFHFAGGVEVQVFSFTGFEDWEITFPGGAGQYSNYARPYARLIYVDRQTGSEN